MKQVLPFGLTKAADTKAPSELEKCQSDIWFCRDQNIIPAVHYRIHPPHYEQNQKVHTNYISRGTGSTTVKPWKTATNQWSHYSCTAQSVEIPILKVCGERFSFGSAFQGLKASALKNSQVASMDGLEPIWMWTLRLFGCWPHISFKYISKKTWVWTSEYPQTKERI